MPALTTAAAIDRLVHHCVILELNISSYRAEQAKKTRQARTVEPGSAEAQPGKGPAHRDGSKSVVPDCITLDAAGLFCGGDRA